MLFQKVSRNIQQFSDFSKKKPAFFGFLLGGLGWMWCITPMPCVHYHVRCGCSPCRVHCIRLAGWWWCMLWGCPWHHIVGSCGAVLCRAVVSVDGLYEALPFRQCRAFFLKCRCGLAGWVSPSDGLKWGCMGALNWGVGAVPSVLRICH